MVEMEFKTDKCFNENYAFRETFRGICVLNSQNFDEFLQIFCSFFNSAFLS